MPLDVLKLMEEKPLRHEIYKQIYIKLPLFFFLLILDAHVNSSKN